MTCLW